jgi:hypothetical protein
MKKNLLIKISMVTAMCIFFAGIIIFESCQNTSKDDDGKLQTNIIIPKNFPAGINFPVDSATILGWLSNYDTTDITKHAWEIWRGLTSNAGEQYGPDSLLIYETWFGPRELAYFCTLTDVKEATLQQKKSRTELKVPHQFAHAGMLRGEVVDTQKGFNVFESVAYNIPASVYAVKNKIFNASVLQGFYGANGGTSIPPFPNNSITTKPTYYAGKADKKGRIRVPVWPGSPSPAKNLPVDSFAAYVYADITNSQPANKVPVPVTQNNPTDSQINAAMVNVNDFIHYKIDAAMAAYLNEVDIDPVSAGDFKRVIWFYW